MEGDLASIPSTELHRKSWSSFDALVVDRRGVSHPTTGRLTFAVLSLVLAALAYGSAAYAQDGFELLGEKEIRARVVGKDISDSYRWVTYLRPDGALLIDKAGRKWTGIWKIRNNKLCMSSPGGKSLDCNEVWISGENIRLRARKDEETFDAVVGKHKAE